MGDVDGVEAYLEAQVDEKVRSRRASGMMREAGGRMFYARLLSFSISAVKTPRNPKPWHERC